ncbi:MAG TPA: OmpA family protein [Labilithrix sp.]|jgi:outer membrane protein OmpA-like peptidoglycan-associated protein
MRSTLAFFFAVMLVPLGASAQPRPNAIPSSNGDGIDTHLFRPALDSRGLIAVNGADVLDAGRVSLGLTIDYGRNILRAPEQPLVANSLTGTVHFSYGIANRAVVGVSAPALVMSGDATSAVSGWGPQALDEQSIGWIALHGKVELLKPKSGLGVALGAQVGVPVSEAARNAGGDPSVWWWPSLIVERRFGESGAVKLAANVGWRGHVASATAFDLKDGHVRDGSRVTYGAGASFRVLDPLDLVVETYGTYLLASDASAAVRPSNEALAGIKLFVEKSSYLVLAAGPRYTNGFEAADLRGVLGFLFEPPAYDSDGDGIVDGEDACPTTPGVKSSDPDKNGCPLDSDEDGIPDTEDACPFVKGPRRDDPKTNGCPDVIVNPPPIDTDHDEVPDVEDACPHIKGDRHPEDPKRNGCPDVYVGPTTIVFFDKIQFETNSAKIRPESNGTLDKVAKAILDHPELRLIEVAGHADERGSEQLNLSLTQARVDSVMVALVARGVDKSRLRARGYGYYCPVEDGHGHDEESWSKNRRVEFVLVKTDNGLTGAPLGCDEATKHGVPPLPVPP